MSACEDTRVLHCSFTPRRTVLTPDHLFLANSHASGKVSSQLWAGSQQPFSFCAAISNARIEGDVAAKRGTWREFLVAKLGPGVLVGVADSVRHIVGRGVDSRSMHNNRRIPQHGDLPEGDVTLLKEADDLVDVRCCDLSLQPRSARRCH